MTTQAELDGAAVGRLRESLIRLASDANSQLQYLRRIGVAECADELAEDLFELRLMAPGLLERGVLTPEQVEAIVDLDGMLRDMSGESQQDLWFANGLRSSRAWENVRERSREYLFLFD